MIIPVLICDDSSAARKQMAQTLPDDWDVEISFARHGEETLAAIKEGLGAIEFIKKPRSKEALAELLQKISLYRPATDFPGDALPVERTVFKAEIGKIEYRDCIQEITNVAMGQAADLLARRLNVFVKLPIPNVNLLEVSELEMALSQTEDNTTYSAVFQDFIGAGICGEALLIFSDSSFEDMAKRLNYKGELSRDQRYKTTYPVIMSFAWSRKYSPKICARQILPVAMVEKNLV